MKPRSLFSTQVRNLVWSAAIPFRDARVEYLVRNPALSVAADEGLGAPTASPNRSHTSIACGSGQAYSVGGPNQPERPFKSIYAAEPKAGRDRARSDLLRSPDGSALFAHGERRRQNEVPTQASDSLCHGN